LCFSGGRLQPGTAPLSQNDTQRQQIAKLESELQVSVLQLERLKRQLASAQEKGDFDIESLKQEIA